MITRLRRRVAGATPMQKGVACILAVTVFFGCMDALAKALATKYDPFFVVWARYASQAVAALLIFAPRLREIVRTERLGLQIFRSGLLFAATIMFFAGFAIMPLAEVIAVAQVAPLAITAMAALVLSEKVGPYRWAAVVIGFLGALVILRPGGEGFGWAALLPLGGALSFAAYGVATRFLGSEDSVWTTFFYTGTVGAVAASLAAPFVWTVPAAADLPLLVLVGLFGAGGQAMLILAMSFAPASLLAPFLYVNLVWATLFGFIFFDETPDLYTVLGAAIIVGAGLFVRWRERRAGRRSTAPPVDGAAR